MLIKGLAKVFIFVNFFKTIYSLCFYVSALIVAFVSLASTFSVFIFIRKIMVIQGQWRENHAALTACRV